MHERDAKCPEVKGDESGSKVIPANKSHPRKEDGKPRRKAWQSKEYSEVSEPRGEQNPSDENFIRRKTMIKGFATPQGKKSKRTWAANKNVETHKWLPIAAASRDNERQRQKHPTKAPNHTRSKPESLLFIGPHVPIVVTSVPSGSPIAVPQFDQLLSTANRKTMVLW